MTSSAIARPHDEVRAEIGALRTEVDRLAAELAEVRAHAARLEALAHEDPLTGLLNRRGFLRDLGRAIAYRARYGTPAALLIADLDRFKAINDTHGHDAGDRALSLVADLLRRNVRASDGIGRLGGDEFGLILWQVEDKVAAQKAASLQAIVDAAALDYGAASIPLSVSIGAAMLQADDRPETALVRADRAMYAQKSERRAGRS